MDESHGHVKWEEKSQMYKTVNTVYMTSHTESSRTGKTN